MAQYTKGMLYQEYTKRVLGDAARDILQAQRTAVQVRYNRRSGSIVDDLSDDIASVRPYSGGTELHFDYTTALRYLDMRKTATGGKKKVYAPVYNKILWGHFYGVTVPQLRYGLNASIEKNIIEDLKKSYNDLSNGY